MHLHILLPIVLIAVWLLGELACRLKALRIVREIFADVALGPALPGFIPSAAADAAGYELVREVGHIGLCVLLFQIGLQTLIADLRAVWRPASAVAILALAVAGTTVVGPTLLRIAWNPRQA